MKDKVATVLKSKNLKVTPLRKQILKILLNSKKPLTAGQILSKVEANKTSIYRNIDKLLAKEIVVEVYFGDRNKRYEVVSLSHHHHLFCINCHKIEDVFLKEALRKEEKQIAMSQNFKIVKHNLEFFGYCLNCQ